MAQMTLPVKRDTCDLQEINMSNHSSWRTASTQLASVTRARTARPFIACKQFNTEQSAARLSTVVCAAIFARYSTTSLFNAVLQPAQMGCFQLSRKTTKAPSRGCHFRTRIFPVTTTKGSFCPQIYITIIFRTIFPVVIHEILSVTLFSKSYDDTYRCACRQISPRYFVNCKLYRRELYIAVTRQTERYHVDARH